MDPTRTPNPGSGIAAVRTAVRGGATMNGPPLKLNSPKTSKDPLTAYSIGGTTLSGRMVVEPPLV
jgi:hypothetical protein